MIEGPANQASDEQETTRLEIVSETSKRIYICDRCGFEMIEKNCKVVCHNCGSRYDCSDLNIYFD